MDSGVQARHDQGLGRMQSKSKRTYQPLPACEYWEMQWPCCQCVDCPSREVWREEKEESRGTKDCRGGGGEGGGDRAID